ncbi:hypothetical protein [Deinococcus deserti]|uniref:hypothetical protein n=1 Tax=Deinococcus deserti TaxID=310783 RepID=UPI00031E3C79|nr:hypothetical protein [Deinococcus deserti]
MQQRRSSFDTVFIETLRLYVSTWLERQETGVETLIPVHLDGFIRIRAIGPRS